MKMTEVNTNFGTAGFLLRKIEIMKKTNDVND